MGSKRFLKTRTKDDIFFSIDDAREAIKRLEVIDDHGKSEKIIEQKKDLLSQQAMSKPGAQSKVGAASVADIFGFNPINLKQKHANDRNFDDVPVQYRKYYKLLLKLRETVKKDLSKLTSDNLSISVGAANASKSDRQDPDVESFDSEAAISLLSSEQEALTEIEDAIQRIFNGTYGICELTGKAIEPERLLAVPFARFSIEGQKEKEKIRPVEVPRGAIFHGEQSPEELSDFVRDDE